MARPPFGVARCFFCIEKNLTAAPRLGGLMSHECMEGCGTAKQIPLRWIVTATASSIQEAGPNEKDKQSSRKPAFAPRSGFIRHVMPSASFRSL
jgi:hypothetical protein